jgi:hypothetical protein
METEHNESNSYWHNRFLEDFGQESLPAHPISYQYYLSKLKLNPERGTEFAKKWKKMNLDLLEETMTALQELALDGDVETAEYQISRFFFALKAYRLISLKRAG